MGGYQRPPALHAIVASLPKMGTQHITRAQIGAHWVAVISRRCGLAATPHAEHCRADQVFSMLDDREVIGRPALEVAAWALNDAATNEHVRVAVGMAAINSLIEPDLRRCVEMNARDILLQRAPGRHVAMIGHFPFTEELRAAAGRLSVLELHPRPGDLPAEQASAILPQADVIGITGVTLINGTFDTLMQYCRPDAFVVMLGGTTPLSPVLFDYGVDAIAGSIVDDAELVMAGIAAGATFRQLRGKRPALMMR